MVSTNHIISLNIQLIHIYKIPKVTKIATFSEKL